MGEKVISYKQQNLFFLQSKILTKKVNICIFGKAVNSAHIKAVERVARRGIIDELQRVINTLNESYLDVYFDRETEEYPSFP